MFGRIFNPENAFFRTADKLADLVMLSLMWALCSIPLVTLGPATAALYDAAVKILRRGEGTFTSASSIPFGSISRWARLLRLQCWRRRFCCTAWEISFTGWR